MKLADMGWDESFGSCEHEVARVFVVDRDRYIVTSETGEYSAKLTGKFRYTASPETDYPCVGDWVCIQHHENEDAAVISQVLPRKSCLQRKSAGRKVEHQLIAANIDVAFIVQSCHFDFNVKRLERYLVIVNEADIEPIILLTKTDLISSAELNEIITRIREMGVSVRVLPLSNITGDGIDEVRQLMLPARTYCLIGSSGVGKTTLINQLMGSAVYETGLVSETGEGRHTTVRRQLITLDNGAMLLDTPGMRELGILGASEGIEDSYSDIKELASQCRFNDCTHTREPGCAVLKAIKDNRLDQEHYDNYLKIKKESDFYEMSYAEKRKKDKALGKLYSSIQKEKYRHK